MIEFNQNACPKHWIDANTDLRKTKQNKNHFEKYFLKLMNNTAFAKTLEDVTKLSDIKLIPTERRRNHFVSELNYHPTKLFTETFFEK